MFKRIGLLGVRKRLNEIIDYLNNEDIVDIGPLLVTINGRLDNAVLLFGMAFRNIAKLTERLDKLDKRNTNLSAKLMLRKMDADFREDTLGYALEKIEELEARIVSLESGISLRSETEGNDEKPDED